MNKKAIAFILGLSILGVSLLSAREFPRPGRIIVIIADPEVEISPN